jgi:enoyl-CoA hydratase/carnithine racemase
MTTTELLSIEQHDDIVTVGLNRPAARNAINDEMVCALERFFERPPEGTRAVVLHAVGEHFSAGLDLKELMSTRSHDPQDGMRRSRRWHRAFDLIQYGEAPVVSALKGGVIGGGLELASATHVRVAEPSTYFELPEPQRGLFLGGGGSVRIPRIIGASRVVDMMLTGRVLDRDEGLALGLVHYEARAGAGLSRALEVARVIAGNPPMANYAIINGIARIQEMAVGEGLFTETMVTRATRGGNDTAGRITDFFEGRKRSR